MGERGKDADEALPIDAKGQCGGLVRRGASLSTAFREGRVERQDNNCQSANLLALLSREDGVCDGEGGHECAYERSSYGL